MIIINNNQEIYKYGVEFSVSWIKAIGYEKIPDELDETLSGLTDTMNLFVELFKNKVKDNLQLQINQMQEQQKKGFATEVEYDSFWKTYKILLNRMELLK
jgi:hypothetical protein